MNRRTIVGAVSAAVLIVVIGIVIMVWPRRPTVNVRVGSAHFADFETTLPETGTIERPNTQTIATTVPGVLERVAVRPGQRVRAGTLLVTIANPQIVSAAEAARENYRAAAGRASVAAETNALSPQQNRLNVAQAAAALDQAQLALDQTRKDLAAGAETGAGDSGASAAEQRSIADANVARAQTDAREADRIYGANKDLFAEKAISRDALDESQARASEAHVALDRAQQHRSETYANLTREQPLLNERLRAAEDAVSQAKAALAAARVSATQSHGGDLDAARAGAAARYSDFLLAQAQADGLEIRAPFDGTVETVATMPGDAMRPLRPGDPVAAGTQLLTLATSDDFVVRTAVDEQDVAAVAPGQFVRISGEDLGGHVLSGRIASVNAVAQPSTDPANASHQVVTTVRLIGAPSFLREGMTADVEIVTNVKRHVLVVDPAAVRCEAGSCPMVFAVRGNVAVPTPVTVGPMNQTQAIIRSGLANGEPVVADRNAAVVGGATIVSLNPR